MDPTEHATPDYPKPMFELRLEHLRGWHVLRVGCQKCRHVGLVHPDRLRQRWPAHSLVKDLAYRLRCTRCGNRRTNHLEVLRIGRNA